MTTPDWSLVTAARESGGRITPARLKAILPRGDVDAQIAAFARRGYKFAPGQRGSLELVGWPNRLFSEEIAHKLATQVVGHRVETHWTTTSTNDLAKAEARRRREGTVIFAEEQTAGRGRFGHKWIAPRYSALLFSLALHGALAEPAAEALALAGAVAVAEALEETYKLPARIRWPNDVLIDGRKVSGVLVENVGADEEGQWFVVGIGVNVNLAARGVSAGARVNSDERLRGPWRAGGPGAYRADSLEKARLLVGDPQGRRLGPPLGGVPPPVGAHGPLHHRGIGRQALHRPRRRPRPALRSRATAIGRSDARLRPGADDARALTALPRGSYRRALPASRTAFIT